MQGSFAEAQKEIKEWEETHHSEKGRKNPDTECGSEKNVGKGTGTPLQC